LNSLSFNRRESEGPCSRRADLTDSDEFHAHLFGGGGDHGISDAQGMALAEFPQVFTRPVGNCQVNSTEVMISKRDRMFSSSPFLAPERILGLPLAAQLIHIIRAAFDVPTIRPQSEALFQNSFFGQSGRLFALRQHFLNEPLLGRGHALDLLDHVEKFLSLNGFRSLHDKFL
jgi:hypothetical protein